MLGSRYVPGGGTRNWSPIRKAISRAASLYARLSSGAGPRPTGGFKCFRRERARGARPRRDPTNGYAFQIETTYRALRKGFRVVEVPITFVDREVGGSKMSRAIVLEAIWKVPLLRARALRASGRRYRTTDEAGFEARRARNAQRSSTSGRRGAAVRTDRADRPGARSRRAGFASSRSTSTLTPAPRPVRRALAAHGRALRRRRGARDGYGAQPRAYERRRPRTSTRTSGSAPSPESVRPAVEAQSTPSPGSQRPTTGSRARPASSRAARSPRRSRRRARRRPSRRAAPHRGR